ncbi:MAG: hypothetical protein LBC97_04175 [Bifidobacteriaceae bacterium]|jgi:hypothetical protein|nr:hypothetical protein [Bifidobacteriaceae bacterium]
MSMTTPDVVPAGSPRARDDEATIDDVVLYDIAAQAATSLSALIIQRRRASSGGLERRSWDARMRLVKQQRAALGRQDRAGLIAQRQAWLDEAEALALSSAV